MSETYGSHQQESGIKKFADQTQLGEWLREQSKEASWLCQDGRVKTLLKKLVTLPGRLTQRSRQWVARVLVPEAWFELVAALGAAGVVEHPPGRPR